MPFRMSCARAALALSCVLANTVTTVIASETQAPIQILYDVRPPFVSFDGQSLQGSIGQRAQHSLVRSAIAFELHEVPVPRQLLMIQQNLIRACAVARLKTVERLHIGVFSAALAESPPYVAIVRKDAALPEPAALEKWAAQTELRWGVQAGLYYSDFVQEQMRKTRAEVTSFSANHQHFTKLLAAKRIDFVIVQEDEAREMLRAPDADNLRDTLRVQALADLRQGEQRFFYCDKRVPEATLRALNHALREKP